MLWPLSVLWYVLKFYSHGLFNQSNLISQGSCIWVHFTYHDNDKQLPHHNNKPRQPHFVSQEHEKAQITVYTDVRSFWWARDVETTGVKAISGSSSSTSDTSDTTTTIIATFGNSSRGNSSSNIKKRDSRRMYKNFFFVLIKYLVKIGLRYLLRQGTTKDDEKTKKEPKRHDKRLLGHRYDDHGAETSLT